MSITPNQSKESNKPSLEDDEIDHSLGKIQSLAQYYGSIQFARTYPPRATAFYDPSPLSQVQIAHYLTDRQIMDADPLLLEVEREVMDGFANDEGLPPTDTVSTSLEPVRSACGSQDSSGTASSTKRRFEEDGANYNSMKRIRVDSRPNGRMVH
jgi:hypothetical protein